MPLPLHLLCVAILGCAGASSHIGISDRASVEIRPHSTVIEVSRPYSDLDADRQTDHSRAWLLDLAAKKLTADRAVSLVETAADAQKVGNLVRSEQIPEDTSIRTGVGDAYKQLKGIAQSNLTMLRIGSIGFFLFLFGFVVQFTTQQFSKIRSHSNSFNTASAMQRQLGQRPVPSKSMGTASKTEAGMSTQQSDPISLPNESLPDAPPVPPKPVMGKSQPSIPPKANSVSGVPKARAMPKQMQRSSSIKDKFYQLYDALGLSDDLDVSVGKRRVKSQSKPKSNVESETQSDSSSSETSSSEATSHEEQQPRISGPSRRKETLVSSRLPCYPWHTLPTPDMLLSVGPTFHINLKNALPDLLTKRGLHPAGPGRIALVSLWNWPGQRQRALAELYLRDTLANKRAFAGHLARCGLQGIAPLTFLNPVDLRRALKPNLRQPMPKRIQDGLWFLKHAGQDNNLGVTCYRGVHALLNHWEGKGPNAIPASERLHYVAQYEVQNPFLFTTMPGQPNTAFESQHKVTTRAYVLVLGTGRCFLHRELLLKAHPHAYDASDADPLRHVLCHSKYDGVVSARGTDWEHYGTVWPKIADVMGRCFRSFDFEALQDEIILDDGLSTFYRAWNRFWHCLATLPLLRSCLTRRRRGIEEANSMKYALLGLDVIVDEQLRPWFLELNRSPTLVREVRDPAGSRIKDEVVEDFTELLIDPLLRAAAKAASNRPPQGPWGKLQRWAAEAVAPAARAQSRGFVELSEPHARA